MRKATAGGWQRLNAAQRSYIPDMLNWIIEAGNPYFDWLFGDAARTRTVLQARMQSPASELSIGLVTALIDADGDMLGGFIGIEGADLKRRRREDSMAFLQAASREQRPSLARRMRTSRELFPPVEPDEFYLSKMGVRYDARGNGLGRRLVQHFLAEGMASEPRRFRLDVHAENRRAIRLYESVGFELTQESHSRETGMTYLAMHRAARA